MTKSVIIDRIEKHRFGPFHLEVADLRVSGKGDEIESLKRVSFERGNSVAVLVHHVGRDVVVLTKQFRYPVLKAMAAPEQAWILEIPAGIQAPGETAESCASREIVEETGYELQELRPITRFFSSPGGCSERITLFYGRVDGPPSSAGGGLASESENIEVIEMDVGEFLHRIEQSKLEDAKTLVAGLWLQSHRT
jgi:nudix-type nucleoside diphosphatase (YffH/AdpP family)